MSEERMRLKRLLIDAECDYLMDIKRAEKANERLEASKAKFLTLKEAVDRITKPKREHQK